MATRKKKDSLPEMPIPPTAKPLKVTGLDLSPTGSAAVTLVSNDPRWKAPMPVLLPTSKLLLNRGRSGGKKADADFVGMGIKNLVYVAQGIGQYLTEEKPDLVVLEDYSGGGGANPFVLACTGEVTGAAKIWMSTLGIPWKEVAATTLKKFATGSGAGGKENIPIGAYKRWGIDREQLGSGDDNILDAYCLARLALWVAFPDGAGQTDREVLAKIREGGSPRPGKKKKGKKTDD